MPASLDFLFDHPPSPVQEIVDPRLSGRGVRLLVKRDDLLCFPEHPAFMGNKWRKLKYNLRQARSVGHDQLITFGGAFSNHIAAVAAAGARFGFRTAGIIRGERPAGLNATLRYAEHCGMALHFLDRTTYRRHPEPEVQEAILRRAGPGFVIPEGGANAAALAGCRELADEIKKQLAANTVAHYALSCGTGGTAAGLIAGLGPADRVLAFPALRGGFMAGAIQRLLEAHFPETPFPKWSVRGEYHFGGYAKFRPGLIDFMNRFYRQTGIPLDPVYTGKLFYGLFDLTAQGYFPEGTTVLAVHTGGLQGVAGFKERFGASILEY